jgi:hypothetical protein
MQTIQGKTLTSLRAVECFLTEHAERLGGVAESGAARRLEQILTELSTRLTEQSACTLHARGVTQTQAVQRRALVRYHLAPIVRIARSELAHSEELAPFRMPRGTLPVEKLAGLAHGIATAAAPHAALFISAGLPDDFIDELTRAADALVGSAVERTQHLARVHSATAGIRRLLVAARTVVGVLDSFVHRAATDDMGLLAGWDSVRHVTRRARRLAGRTLDAQAQPPAIAAPALRMLPAAVSTEPHERVLPPARDGVLALP